jgi:hypothetical protein
MAKQRFRLADKKLTKDPKEINKEINIPAQVLKDDGTTGVTAGRPKVHADKRSKHDYYTSNRLHEVLKSITEETELPYSRIVNKAIKELLERDYPDYLAKL